MFVSQTDFEFPFPAGLAEPGSHYWRAVELSLSTSWFVATLRSSDEELGFRRTMLVSWDSDLVQVVTTAIGGYLEALMFMAPARRAGGQLWRPHRIKQIWRAYDSDRADEPVFIFTTFGGEQLQGQLAEPPPSSVHGHELLVTVGLSPYNAMDGKAEMPQPVAGTRRKATPRTT